MLFICKIICLAWDILYGYFGINRSTMHHCVAWGKIVTKKYSFLTHWNIFKNCTQITRAYITRSISFLSTNRHINMGELVVLLSFCLISIHITEADKVFNGKGEIYFTYRNAHYEIGTTAIYRPENYKHCKLTVIYLMSCIFKCYYVHLGYAIIKYLPLRLTWTLVYL